MLLLPLTVVVVPMAGTGVWFDAVVVESRKRSTVVCWEDVSAVCELPRSSPVSVVVVLVHTRSELHGLDSAGLVVGLHWFAVLVMSWPSASNCWHVTLRTLNPPSHVEEHCTNQ